MVCVGGMFAAPGGAVFSGLQAVSMYGGLVLFGGFMLYDTQKVIHHAEHDRTYDPINRSVLHGLLSVRNYNTRINTICTHNVTLGIKFI